MALRRPQHLLALLVVSACVVAQVRLAAAKGPGKYKPTIASHFKAASSMVYNPKHSSIPTAPPEEGTYQPPHSHPGRSDKEPHRHHHHHYAPKHTADEEPHHHAYGHDAAPKQPAYEEPAASYPDHSEHSVEEEEEAQSYEKAGQQQAGADGDSVAATLEKLANSPNEFVTPKPVVHMAEHPAEPKPTLPNFDQYVVKGSTPEEADVGAAEGASPPAGAAQPEQQQPVQAKVAAQEEVQSSQATVATDDNKLWHPLSSNKQIPAAAADVVAVSMASTSSSSSSRVATAAQPSTAKPLGAGHANAQPMRFKWLDSSSTAASTAASNTVSTAASEQGASVTVAAQAVTQVAQEGAKAAEQQQQQPEPQEAAVPVLTEQQQAARSNAQKAVDDILKSGLPASAVVDSLVDALQVAQRGQTEAPAPEVAQQQQQQPAEASAAQPAAESKAAQEDSGVQQQQQPQAAATVPVAVAAEGAASQAPAAVEDAKAPANASGDTFQPAAATPAIMPTPAAAVPAAEAPTTIVPGAPAAKQQEQHVVDAKAPAAATAEGASQVDNKTAAPQPVGAAAGQAQQAPASANPAAPQDKLSAPVVNQHHHTVEVVVKPFERDGLPALTSQAAEGLLADLLLQQHQQDAAQALLLLFFGSAPLSTAQLLQPPLHSVGAGEQLQQLLLQSQLAAAVTAAAAEAAAPTALPNELLVWPGAGLAAPSLASWDDVMVQGWDAAPDVTGAGVWPSWGAQAEGQAQSQS